MLAGAQKIASAQDICHQGFQRRCAGTLTKAGVIKAQDNATGTAEEFHVMPVGGKIAGGARTKQDNWPVVGWCVGSLFWGQPLTEEPMQRNTLGVGEDDCLGVQAEVGRLLIAISVGK